ncbi:MAG: hypothetical protein RQ826_09370 [Xanthomonadales bacterium]|nr:hypothetical protein [Xanthomonadales bacterium]
MVRTGSWAHKHGSPFYRHFGPDLAGIFTADTGAFGVKARVVLRLLPWPGSILTASFGYDRLEDMLAAQIELARLGVTAECYGFDPYYNKTFEDRGFSFKQSLKTLLEVVRSGNSTLAGLRDAVRVACSGRKVLRGVNFSLHLVCEGASRQLAAGKLRIARRVCLDKGGVEIDNSLPTVFNAAPFDGVSAVLLGGNGEIWLPVHGFMPLSRAQQVGAAVEAFFEANRSLMEEHGIRTSYLTCFSGSEFVIEPSFYWYDEIQQFRLDRIELQFREKWKGRSPEPEKRKVALGLREELRDLMDSHGCCHLQLARFYPYGEMMANEPLWQLLKDVKALVDEHGRMNPGALGLPEEERS